MAKTVSPIIGLAVVVALAMAAVFGAMSLTPSPAHAQAADPKVTTVNVDVIGAVAADQEAGRTIDQATNVTALKGGVNLGFNVEFTIANGQSFGSGDTIKIEMPGFGTPRQRFA